MCIDWDYIFCFFTSKNENVVKKSNSKLDKPVYSLMNLN